MVVQLMLYSMPCEAGLVRLVVLRDVALVCGAVYHRASSLGWKVG
jgi:cardiolipin synthase